MPRKTDANIMTQTEMIEYGKQKRATSSVYKAESMQITDEAISKTVMRGLSELAHADKVQKIDMTNIDMVKQVSLAYVRSCADTATFPTMSGLARAMGCHRSLLYHWMKRKDTKTGQWLLLCHDLYSDLLAELSLRNNCNPVVGIFLQKAMYGLSETENIQIVNQMQEDEYEYRDSHYKDKYRRLIGE